MAESTSTTLTELIPNEVLQESRLAFQKNAGILPLVQTADLSNRPGTTAEFPVHVVATVTKPANETTDVTTSSTMDPTSVTQTVVRRTAHIDLADLARESTVEDVNVTAGRLIGNARIKQVETDILANMTTNYTSSVGATNSTAITPEQILSALLTLKNNEANENLVLAISPNQEFHLLDDLVVTSSSDTDRSAEGMAATRDGVIKDLYGIRVLSTPRVSTGTDTNDIYLGMLFNSKELGYTVKNIPPLIEFERDATKALTEIVMNYYDSSGRIRAAAFVLVKSQTY